MTFHERILNWSCRKSITVALKLPPTWKGQGTAQHVAYPVKIIFNPSLAYRQYWSNKCSFSSFWRWENLGCRRRYAHSCFGYTCQKTCNRCCTICCHSCMSSFAGDYRRCYTKTTPPASDGRAEYLAAGMGFISQTLPTTDLQLVHANNSLRRNCGLAMSLCANR